MLMLDWTPQSASEGWRLRRERQSETFSRGGSDCRSYHHAKLGVHGAKHVSTSGKAAVGFVPTQKTSKLKKAIRTPFSGTGGADGLAPIIEETQSHT